MGERVETQTILRNCTGGTLDDGRLLAVEQISGIQTVVGAPKQKSEASRGVHLDVDSRLPHAWTYPEPAKFRADGRSDQHRPLPGVVTDPENFGPVYACPWDVPPSFILTLLRRAYRKGYPVGVDTEFDHDLQLSPAFRALPLLWSLGIPLGDAFHAGAPLATRVVLAPEALPEFQVWFRSDHTKVFHNAGVDLHVLHNAGYVVEHVQDTLSASRYLHPHRKLHGLKWHIEHTLGYRGMDSYKHNFFRPKLGVNGQLLKTTEAIPLQSIIPGVHPSWAGPVHPLWDRLKRYASLDAKATVELWMKFNGSAPAVGSQPSLPAAPNVRSSKP